MKTLPKEPRYERANKIAYSLLQRFCITELPIDPFKILSDIGKIALIPYSKIMQDFGFTLNETVASLGTQDGHAQMKPEGNPYIIYYNDFAQVKERINWTLAHELGHIALNHLNDFPELEFCRSGLTDEQYTVLEKEADSFAGSLLSPLIVLKEIGVNSNHQIKSLCNISDEAAKHRFTSLIRYSKRKTFMDYDIRLLSCFSDYIEHKEYLSRMGIMNCPHCKSYLMNLTRYCKICGTRTTELELNFGKRMMIHDAIATDHSGKAIECPICNTEDIGSGPSCNNCGCYITNRCSNSTGFSSCAKILDGDARYCDECGYESDFHRQGILSTWKRNKVWK